MPTPSDRTERLESAIQILILMVVGSMAGLASFTHVHDWTMQHVPDGTGHWFGWANAIISELTPTAAGLEIRRRKRHGGDRSVLYPMSVLIAAAALSIAAQFAVAQPTPSGWLLNVIPALAFLALTKLALSGSTPTRRPSRDQASASPHPSSDTITTVTAEIPRTQTPSLGPATPIPDELVQGARMAVFTHQQRSQAPITAAILAEHLGVGIDTAAALLTHLDGTHDGGRP